MRGARHSSGCTCPSTVTSKYTCLLPTAAGDCVGAPAPLAATAAVASEADTASLAAEGLSAVAASATSYAGMAILVRDTEAGSGAAASDPAPVAAAASSAVEEGNEAGRWYLTLLAPPAVLAGAEGCLGVAEGAPGGGC